MGIDNAEAQLIGKALYEMRLLLSSYLGSESEAPTEVRIAAHLAYALHNEASAFIAGDGFDVAAALRKVAAIDNILQVSDGSRLAHSWNPERKTEP